MSANSHVGDLDRGLLELTRMYTADLTDKVAKESTDSTASSHENHDVDHSHATSGGSSGKATSQDHKSTPVCFDTFEYSNESNMKTDLTPRGRSCPVTWARRLPGRN